MIFTKKILDSEKKNAVYMWNMNPNEKTPIPMQNINKNKRFFNEVIIGPKEVESLVLRMETPSLRVLWDQIPWWIVRADLGRLLYVYLNGGFYFDADCLVKKNFLSDVKENMVLFVEKTLSSTSKLGPKEKKTEERLLRVANYAFGSGIKKHPFLKRVIDECLNRLSEVFKSPPEKISELDVVWLCGPDVMTSVYHDFKSSHSDLLLLDKKTLKHQSFGGWRD